MEPNVLLVSVLSAKGLYLKGHPVMDALVTVTMHGRGSMRSRAVTEPMHTDGDCRWDEHMEFKISDPTASLTVCAQHKSRLGRNDVIGRVELPLDQARGIRGDHWYPLRKKSGEDKYRGEVQIRFEFRFEKSQLSISNQSLNTIGQKESVMDKIKGKIKLGKLRHKHDPDGMSIASGVSGISGVSSISKISKGGTISRLFGKKNKDKDGGLRSAASFSDLRDARSTSPMPPTTSTSMLEPPGQSAPPAAFQRAGSRRWQHGSMRQLPTAMPPTPVPTPIVIQPHQQSQLQYQHYPEQQQQLQQQQQQHEAEKRRSWLMHESPFDDVSVTLRNTSEAASNGGEPAPLPTAFVPPVRPPSVASSGIGSNHNRHPTGSDDANEGSGRDDLLAKIDKLEMEVRVKESRLRDMEEYIDGLLSRVMERCPEVLASNNNASSLGLKAKHRFYSTIGF